MLKAASRALLLAGSVATASCASPLVAEMEACHLPEDARLALKLTPE
jgi:hypothetical protein